jgi:hypothetical protein
LYIFKDAWQYQFPTETFFSSYRLLLLSIALVWIGQSANSTPLIASTLVCPQIYLFIQQYTMIFTRGFSTSKLSSVASASNHASSLGGHVALAVFLAWFIISFIVSYWYQYNKGLEPASTIIDLAILVLIRSS